MWVKKLPHELKKFDQRYFNPKRPVLCSIGIFFLTAFTIKIGYDKWGPEIDPITWRAFFDWGFKKAVGIAILFGLVFYVWQLITKKLLFETNLTQICESCNKIKSFDENIECECGGQFINIDKMKWIDDKEDL